MKHRSFVAVSTFLAIMLGEGFVGREYGTKTIVLAQGATISRSPSATNEIGGIIPADRADHLESWPDCHGRHSQSSDDISDALPARRLSRCYAGDPEGSRHM